MPRRFSFGCFLLQYSDMPRWSCVHTFLSPEPVVSWPNFSRVALGTRMVFVRNSCPSYPQFSLVAKVLSLPTLKDPGLSCKGKFSTQLQPSSVAYCINPLKLRSRAKRASCLGTLLKRCCTLYYPYSKLSCKKSGFCKLRKVVARRKKEATK